MIHDEDNPPTERFILTHEAPQTRTDWGVWDYDPDTWAVCDGIVCRRMTRWEARQMLGFLSSASTGEETP